MAKEYIERKAVKAVIKKRLGTMDLFESRFNADIDAMPAADVVEVKHGRWEEWRPPTHMILTGEERLYRCSACDAKYTEKENMRYCPWCGAAMDLEADNEL